MKVFTYKNSIDLNNVKSAIAIRKLFSRYYICFIKNGELHHSKHFAEIEIVGNVNFYLYHFHGESYNECQRFTNKSWRKFNKNIIRSKKLKIFK